MTESFYRGPDYWDDQRARSWEAKLKRLLADARHKLALWRYDYNNVRPRSSLGNQTPAEVRRALGQFEGSTHNALAQTDDKGYEIQIVNSRYDEEALGGRSSSIVFRDFNRKSNKTLLRKK